MVDRRRGGGKAKNSKATQTQLTATRP